MSSPPPSFLCHHSHGRLGDGVAFPTGVRPAGGATGLVRVQGSRAGLAHGAAWRRSAQGSPAMGAHRRHDKRGSVLAVVAPETGPALAQGGECAGLGPEKGGGPSSKNRSLYYIWSGSVPQQQITILHMPGHARLAALVHLLRGCVRRLGSGFEDRESEPALPPADARQTAKSRLKSSTDQVSNFPFFSNLESRCLNFSIFA